MPTVAAAALTSTFFAVVLVVIAYLRLYLDRNLGSRLGTHFLLLLRELFNLSKSL